MEWPEMDWRESIRTDTDDPTVLVVQIGLKLPDSGINGIDRVTIEVEINIRAASRGYHVQGLGQNTVVFDAPGAQWDAFFSAASNYISRTVRNLYG
jgi:hypothetical protein